jgi:hypothetical protein
MLMGVLFGNRQIHDTAWVAKAIQALSQFTISQIFKPVPWPMWAPVPGVSNARKTIHHINPIRV